MLCKDGGAAGDEGMYEGHVSGRVAVGQCIENNNRVIVSRSTFLCAAAAVDVVWIDRDTTHKCHITYPRRACPPEPAARRRRRRSNNSSRQQVETHSLFSLSTSHPARRLPPAQAWKH